MVYMQMQSYENPENKNREVTSQTFNGRVKESVKEEKKTGAMNYNRSILLSTFLFIVDVERQEKETTPSNSTN